MTDEEFREQHQPLHVPSAYESTLELPQKVVFALADLDEGTADAVARHLQELDAENTGKEIIAKTHQLLTEWYNNGHVAANERDGSLVFNLHKITRANDGEVDPDLLAPGLD